ncbi:GerMN domain-containing protein [Arthrobacter cryoconiti]|uniref:GerMN domain-containing protein n=1 Tax=Arthrobacter cryoconiti TaxID=748907 RepID=A0ABV8QWF2_9MICC|nr:GerMN domain-containing protein [Arthrobacter cryoconiti]MCC9069499.1 GerMN domain-containing protein [Arthrobacter cryoconiti]
MKRYRRLLGIASLALALTLTTVSCTPGPAILSQHSALPTTASGQDSGLPTTTPLETPTANQKIPVYWLGHSNESVFLYREFSPVPTTDDPIVASLRIMMADKPQDPDFFSVWNEPSQLGASISAKNVITIDISSDAFAQKVDAGIAERSIAQLVYTATASASMSGLIDPSANIGVSILVDGHTGYNAFGHVLLDKPLTRNTGFVAPVWITEPSNGTVTKALPLNVSGSGMSPTGKLVWILEAMEDGKVSHVAMSGTVEISQGPNELGSFNFVLVPPLGNYQVSVFIEDPSRPGVRVGVDTKVLSISAP